jgi:hypothetical protein
MVKVVEVDYKNLPPEVIKQLCRDSLNVIMDILREENLPDPEKLEKLADWFKEPRWTDFSNKEVQAELRKWAKGLRDLQKLFESSRKDQKENPVIPENSLLRAKAAPEMLEALKDIRGWREAPDTLESMEYIQDVANKAICLATGEKYIPPKFPLKF